jgi:hypothetical protein
MRTKKNDRGVASSVVGLLGGPLFGLVVVFFCLGFGSLTFSSQSASSAVFHTVDAYRGCLPIPWSSLERVGVPQDLRSHELPSRLASVSGFTFWLSIRQKWKLWLSQNGDDQPL